MPTSHWFYRSLKTPNTNEGMRKMGRRWEADTSVSFVRRLGKSASELGQTDIPDA
jgi:hypothetical protein